MADGDVPQTIDEPGFLTMPRAQLADYLRQLITFFPANLPQKFPRLMLENFLCPRGYWHDLDSPMVQEVLISLRDEGLVNLVFREETYVTFNAERKAELAAQLGSYNFKI